MPSVLLLGAGLLWLGRREPRTDVVRASVVVWGGWVLVTGLTFSFMGGIIHPYYMVALAPGLAGLAGLGGVLLWQHRARAASAVPLAAAVLAAGFLAMELLGRTPAYVPWLRWAVLAGAIAATVVLLLPLAGRRVPASGPLMRTTAAVAVSASLAGPLAYSLATAAAPHTGAIVSAGPAAAAFGQAGPGGRTGLGASVLRQQPNAAGPNPGFAGGAGFAGAGGAGGGAAGGLLGASTPSSAMVSALKAGAGNYTWAAAVVGSNNAAGYQLATALPVMPLGGFNGTDPAPTLAQFQQLVSDGKIHYFIAARMMQGSTGSEAAAEISAWVQASFAAQTIDGTTVYLLAG